MVWRSHAGPNRPHKTFPDGKQTQVNVLLDAGFYAPILPTIGKIVGAVPLDKSSAAAEDRLRVREAVSDALASATRPLLFFPG